jgi:hypothetical protein
MKTAGAFNGLPRELRHNMRLIWPMPCRYFNLSLSLGSEGGCERLPDVAKHENYGRDGRYTKKR